MSKFSEFAEQWVAGHSAGNVPSKSFARVLACAKARGINIPEDDLAALNNAARNEYCSHIGTAGMCDTTAAAVRRFAQWADNNLSDTPAPVAELLGCEWSDDGYLTLPDGARWNPYYTTPDTPAAARGRFRDLLHAAAAAGIIREQRVSICGKAAMYLYSL